MVRENCVGVTEWSGSNCEVELHCIWLPKWNFERTLLFTRQDITLTPEESRALQLEVITTSDQYKDYDQKNIVVTDGLICNISPNPVNTLTEVCVELSEGTSSAVLMVYNVNHNLVNNYIVQGSGEIQVQLDLSNYTQGTYQVVLFIDSVVSDIQHMIKLYLYGLKSYSIRYHID